MSWGGPLKCFGLLSLLASSACADQEPPPPVRTHDERRLVETADLPAVISVDDLMAIGFDSMAAYQIEPHFAALNTALVAMAELKKSYDAARDPQQRAELDAYAIPFHLTADRHQRFILQLLAPPLDSLFDRYVEARKRAVGLTDWHVDHRRPTPGLPGLTPPGRPRHR